MKQYRWQTSVKLGLVLAIATSGCAEVVDEQEATSTDAVAISVGLPKMPASQVDDAIERQLTDFGAFGGAGTNSGFFGSSMVILAAASYSGNTAADARLKQQLRYNVSPGHDPSGAGGFSNQHELRFVVAAALARMTPRIWDALTSAEKKKIDLVVRGVLVGAAYTTSSTNPEIKKDITRIRNLRGDEQWWRGNPNFKCAGPATVLAARVFFGSAAAVTSLLNGFDKAEFASALKAHELTNMHATFELDGPGGKVGPRPSTADVEAAVKDWKWAINDAGVDDAEAIYTTIIDSTFSKPVASGLNGGAGIVVNGEARGRIIDGAAGLPNKGAIGMAHEFATVDAEGQRSAASYVMFGTRVALDVTTVAICGGLVNRSSPAVKSTTGRMHVGMVDLKYKSDHGYRSYSHGGTGGNNEDWTPALRSEQWGWSYTFGQWFEMLEPYLDGQQLVSR